MRKLCKLLFLALSVSVIAISCLQVDTDFDLEKEIDTNVNVGGDIGVPVGSTQLLRLGDILPADSDYLVLKNSGDYSIRFSKGFNWSLSVPEFHIDKYEDEGGSLSFKVDIPAFNQSATPPLPFKISSSISYQHDEVPQQITEIKSITGELQLTLRLSLSQSPSVFSDVTLLKGTKVVFPECFNIAEVFDSSVEIIDGNIISYSSDITIPTDGTVLALTAVIDSFDFSKLPSGQGLISPGHIFIDVPVSIDGRFSLTENTQSLSERTMTDLGFKFDISSSSITIEEVTGRVVISEDIKSDPIDIDVETDLFDLKNAKLDFTDPSIEVLAKNEFPMAADVNLKVVTSSDGKTLSTLALGAKNGTDAISVPSEAQAKYWISCSPEHPDGYTGIKADNLGTLFLTFPDRIELSEMNFQSNDGLVSVALGKDYNIDLNVSVDLPLAFGPQFRISSELQLDDLLDLDGVSFKHAEITADIINTIPLGLDISGNLKEMDIDCTVAPGNINAPATSPVKITLLSEKPISSLGGFVIKFELSCSDPSYSGVCLNKDQGIKLENVKLHIYEGVNLDLNQM